MGWMLSAALLQAAGFLAAAPLLKAAIKKMKATLQNRQGPPLLQGYYDLAKLLRKDPLRSETATWVYMAGPRVYLAAAVAATTLVPVLVAGAPLETAGAAVAGAPPGGVVGAEAGAAGLGASVG